MYACMYVRTYVCMHACMYVLTYYIYLLFYQTGRIILLTLGSVQLRSAVGRIPQDGASGLQDFDACNAVIKTWLENPL